MARTYAVLVVAFLLFVLAPTWGGGDEEAIHPSHPAVAEILAMAEAGVGDAVIVARIERMEEVPALDGQSLAALKRQGISDVVLEALVRRSGKVAVPSGQARLSVRFEATFPVHFLEVTIDGSVVLSRGKILTGRSEPGGVLERPRAIPHSEGKFLVEVVVEAGSHLVEVGYAVIDVETDPDDPWREYSRERYRVSGVATSAGKPAAETLIRAEGVRFEIDPGETRQLVVVASRRPAGRLGGRFVYGIEYR